jgi:mersacidin/lichenicidin family type 2 lantibiotic
MGIARSRVMKRETIVRAWKDPEFRASLTAEERSVLPECPAGTAFTELEEGELADAVGGNYYRLEEGCICSDWTMPVTTRLTTTRTPVIRLDTIALGQNALNVR